MKMLLKGGQVYAQRRFVQADVLTERETVLRIAPEIFPDSQTRVIPCEGCIVVPGLIDVHVHLREPGFSYKETICSGTAAAARGGYCWVCAMPNLHPVPDNLETLRGELEILQRDAKIHVRPYGAITKGEKGLELAEMAEMAPFVAGFSDDGKGVASPERMREAMREAQRLGKILAAHCEDEELLGGKHVHDGIWARKLGIRGISAESEWKQVARDLELARETGCKYHACHLSTRQSVEEMRRAKGQGLDVSCETAPHYLLLNETMLRDEGNFKMNPPIRKEEDRQALLEGLRDGTIDLIATDHAPHSREEKAGGLLGSLMGIVGLETAFALAYTHLVEPGVLTLERLMDAMHDRPMDRFGLGEDLAEGAAADIAVFDLRKSWKIDPERFLSLGRSTPFAGWEVRGKTVLTLVGGKAVFACTTER